MRILLEVEPVRSAMMNIIQDLPHFRLFIDKAESLENAWLPECVEKGGISQMIG